MTVLGEAFVRVRPDTSTFRAETTRGVKSSLTGLGGAAGRLGGLGIVSGAIVALGTAVAVTAKQAAGFEQTMNVLQTVSAATDEQVRQLSESAKQLGADLTLPSISAQDAATAELELSKAGLSVKDTLAGTKGVLQLATAGNIGVADSARIAASALNAFGLGGDQATHVADLLAGASIAAQGEVADMGESLAQASSVARQFGLTVEETVGAITLLARNGILGSDAGTSLRTTLQRLIPTTKEAQQITDQLGIAFEDTKGNILPLTDIVDQYGRAFKRLDESTRQQVLTQVFGSDAARAAGILFREGSAGLDEQTRAADRAGAANELATARTKGLSGAVSGLQSSVQTLGLELGQLSKGPLTDLVRGLNEGVGTVTDLVKAMKQLHDVKLPPWIDIDLGGAIKDAFKNVVPGAKALGDVRKAIAEASKVDMGELALGTTDSLFGGDFFGRIDRLWVDVGVKTGKTYTHALARGIVSEAQAAVNAARLTLAQVIEQGRVQVAQAIADAQRNLTTIGATLAAQAAQAIDVGPVARRIATLSEMLANAQAARTRISLRQAVADAQAALRQALAAAPIQARIDQLQRLLDRRDAGEQRRSLNETVRDAQEALRAAQAQLVTRGDLSAATLAGNARFLRPFQEDVRDAKAELADFNAKGTIEGLQAKLAAQAKAAVEPFDGLRQAIADARDSLSDFTAQGLIATLTAAAAAQKKAVTDGLADIVSDFNAGRITLAQLNQRIASTLAGAGVDYRKAGAILGSAFRDGFAASLAGLRGQAAAIVAGPQRPGAGARATIVSPTAVQKAALQATGVARADLQAKQSALTKGTNALLDRIAKDLERDRPKKPAKKSVAAKGARDSDFSSLPALTGVR